MSTTTTARARRTDPTTSHEAARSVVGVGNTRERVLALLHDAGPNGLTHEELVRAHRRREVMHGWPAASVSSLRTRCRELFDDDLVEVVPDGDGIRYGRSSAGRRAHYWRAVSVQSKETTVHDASTDVE